MNRSCELLLTLVLLAAAAGSGWVWGRRQPASTPPIAHDATLRALVEQSREAGALIVQNRLLVQQLEDARQALAAQGALDREKGVKNDG